MTHADTPSALDEAVETAAELRTLTRDIVGDAQENQADTVERPLDPAVWETFEEAGLARLTGAESSGGSAAGWLEAAAVLSEAAAAGTPLPLLEHDLLAGWLRDTAGLPAPAAASGDAPVLSTAAEVRVVGRAVTVPWLPAAASVVVLDTSGDQPRVHELAVADLTITERGAIDGEPQATVTLPEPGADAVIVSQEVADEFRLRGALGRAIQIAGAAESITDMCVEHVTTRVQFGRPIGKFQAVQQLVTDVASETALTRTIVDRAVLSAAQFGLADPRTQFQIAAAKACAGGSAEVIVRNAHQIHGAIGTTIEHGLQRRTRPVLAWRREFGTTTDWEDRIEELVLADGADLWDLITS